MIYSEYDLLKAMDMIYNYLNYKPMDDCMRNRDRLEQFAINIQNCCHEYNTECNTLT